MRGQTRLVQKRQGDGGRCHAESAEPRRPPPLSHNPLAPLYARCSDLAVAMSTSLRQKVASAQAGA